MDVDQREIDRLLHGYKNELEEELQNILVYWKTQTVDREHGGFYGRINCSGRVDPVATKSAVLHTRILWTFSAAAIHTKDHSLLSFANRAYEYLIDHFIDQENGGLYWSVQYDGTPADTKKQVYAIAFAIYALSEYYQVTHKEEIRNLAIRLFELIEKHALDQTYGGYIEALTIDWKPIGDLRLSNKDANEKKSMNTHLHVLEAYTALYKIWPDQKLKQQLLQLLPVFEEHIIHPQTGHLQLFFTEQWQLRSDLISFGHDIEAAWLLAEAATAIGDVSLQNKINTLGLKIAEAAKKGLDADGGLYYEYFITDRKWVKEKHWWPQAEAMVGFFHAWQTSGNRQWMYQSIQSWAYVKEKLLDKQNGEWFWGIDEKGEVMVQEDKAGFWKCPYHNSRACLEIIKRIQPIIPNER